MVLATPSAFSPGSVTCFFSPVVHESAEKTCSRGVAINLSHGVVAALRPATSILTTLNGRPIDLPPVRHVVETLAPEPVALQFETALPLGCGFGVSAACALTAAFAIARRYDLPSSRTELGMAAHVAEVVHRTGYGDVASQLCGGFVYRRCQHNTTYWQDHRRWRQHAPRLGWLPTTCTRPRRKSQFDSHPPQAACSARCRNPWSGVN